jgi:hypothetical protein
LQTALNRDWARFIERQAPEAIDFTLDELERAIWTFATE